MLKTDGALDIHLDANFDDGTELTANSDILGVLFDGDMVPTVEQMKVK